MPWDVVSNVSVVDAVVIRYSTPPGKYSVSKVGVHNHRPTTDVKLAGCQVRRVSRSANHSEAVVPPTYVLVCHAQVNRAPAGFHCARACVMRFITALVPSPRVPSYAGISIWLRSYEVSHRTIIRRSPIFCFVFHDAHVLLPQLTQLNLRCILSSIAMI